MTNNDQAEFHDLLKATLEVYGQDLSAAATGIWWNSLKRFDLAKVRESLSVHVQSPQGRFAPKPADLIAWLDGQSSNGHPGAEEAWSMVANSLNDERATLVLTGPMRTAFFAVDGMGMDKISARMAFLEVYRREVQGADAPQWSAILGWDVAGRTKAIEDAVALGRISAPHALVLLPSSAVEERDAIEAQFPAMQALR